MPLSIGERPPIYRGRFAPSPSGYLHFGSLVTALASFLDARAKQGIWLVRIEDIDPPREREGASKHILNTLEAYGLHWDESVLYQSQQSDLYKDILNNLAQQKLSYPCQCTRAEIKASGGIYQGVCKSKKLVSTNNAIRMVNKFGINAYEDIIQQTVTCDKSLASEDFILLRKDGLYAYQLAVVADDIYQGITHVIRGCDLLEPTARQLTLFKQLNKSAPKYGHIPLAITEQGYKLSKQNKAPAINCERPQPSLIAALEYLAQKPPKALHDATTQEVIDWAIKNWCRESIPKVREIVINA